VRLRSADPADPPHIDIAHLRHPEDMTRMIEATRHARRLSHTPPLAGFDSRGAVHGIGRLWVLRRFARRLCRAVPHRTGRFGRLPAGA